MFQRSLEEITVCVAGITLFVVVIFKYKQLEHSYLLWLSKVAVLLNIFNYFPTSQSTPRILFTFYMLPKISIIEISVNILIENTEKIPKTKIK